MEDKTKNKGRARYIISLIFVVLSVLLIPIFSTTACVYHPTYLIVHNYDFRLEDNYLVWNEQGRYVYDSYNSTYWPWYFNYTVYVFNSDYDPLKTMLNEHPYGVNEWTTQSTDSRRFISARGRISLSALGLVNGSNVIRVVSESRSFIRDEGCCNLANMGRNIRYVGFFEVSVQRDYTEAIYEFNVNENLSFGWDGEDKVYAVYIDNDDTDGFSFFGAKRGIDDVYFNRRFNSIQFVLGVNTVKIERVLSASLYGGVLQLKTAIGLWEFEFVYEDNYCYDFNFRVVRWGNAYDLRFDTHRIIYSAYCIFEETNYRSLGISEDWGAGSSRVSLRDIGLEGINTVRVIGFSQSAYEDGVLTVQRDIGEWEFEQVIDIYSPRDTVVAVEHRQFERNETGRFGRTRRIVYYEWVIVTNASYSINTINIVRGDGTTSAGGSATVIRQSRMREGLNTIRISSGDIYMFEYGVLYRTRRYNNIEVYLNRDGTITIL